jgi:phosphoribosyl 1,2-cyclic phosphodiesterase
MFTFLNKEEPHTSHLSFPDAIEEALILKPKQLFLTGFCHVMEHYDMVERLKKDKRLPEAGIVSSSPAFDGLRIPLLYFKESEKK